MEDKIEVLGEPGSLAAEPRKFAYRAVQTINPGGQEAPPHPMRRKGDRRNRAPIAAGGRDLRLTFAMISVKLSE